MQGFPWGVLTWHSTTLKNSAYCTCYHWSKPHIDELYVCNPYTLCWTRYVHHPRAAIRFVHKCAIYMLKAALTNFCTFFCCVNTKLCRHSELRLALNNVLHSSSFCLFVCSAEVAWPWLFGRYSEPRSRLETMKMVSHTTGYYDLKIIPDRSYFTRWKK